MSTHSYFLILSVFLITIVETIEMATIVIAVGIQRGWFATLLGGGAGLVVLAAVVFIFGTLLGDLPLNVLRAVIGILLLLFGVQWLRKSIFRISQSGFWSGEEEEEESDADEEAQGPIEGLDWMGFARGFQGVFLEGLEIAFVVITFGAAANHLGLGAIAAGVAFVLVAGIAIAARNLLTEVPGNTLKLVVGILLTTYGTYWATVGMGAKFPFGDYTVIGVLAIVIVFALIAIYTLRAVQPAEA